MRAAPLPGGWTGNYPPCDRHEEVLKPDPLNLGVRFSTPDRRLAAAFARALDFWATVLEMQWHREEGRDCSVQILSGSSDLFAPAEAARAQFPGLPAFQGWIAFNPKVTLSEDERFLVAVHELGHLFGLSHNPSARSVMFFIRMDGPSLLDAADLTALGARHKLRSVKAPVAVQFSRE